MVHDLFHLIHPILHILLLELQHHHPSLIMLEVLILIPMAQDIVDHLLPLVFWVVLLSRRLIVLLLLQLLLGLIRFHSLIVQPVF